MALKTLLIELVQNQDYGYGVTVEKVKSNTKLYNPI